MTNTLIYLSKLVFNIMYNTANSVFDIGFYNEPLYNFFLYYVYVVQIVQTHSVLYVYVSIILFSQNLQFLEGCYNQL